MNKYLTVGRQSSQLDKNKNYYQRRRHHHHHQKTINNNKFTSLSLSLSLTKRSKLKLRQSKLNDSRSTHDCWRVISERIFLVQLLAHTNEIMMNPSQ